jgi:hypothetical protein
VTLGYLGIGLVLVVGIAVVVYGWLADRTDTKRRHNALTGAPDRPIPGLREDAPTPAYVTEYEALHKGEHRPAADLSDAQRSALPQRLAGAPSLAHGHAAHEFATDSPSGYCVLRAPWILVTDHDLTTIRELLGFVERARAADQAVVVVAPGIGRDVLATLQVNATRHTLRCAAVIVPDGGQRRVLCSLVGATPVPWEDLRAGYVPQTTLGSCSTWVSSSERLWVLSDDLPDLAPVDK